MANIDPLTYIKIALAKDFADQAHRSHSAQQQAHSLVITLSRDYGALGEEIALSLAQALNIPVHDQEILERLAAKTNTDKFHFQEFDEKSPSGLGTFLYGLVSGNTSTTQQYRHYLGEVLLELARKDCIIIGRGAHLALSGQRIFRIRVVGSNTVCAERVAAALDISVAEAEQKVAAVNQLRNQSVLDVYAGIVESCALEQANLFDLVINTDFIPVNVARDMVLTALRGLGCLSEAVRSKA